jgi:hypothetical protein
MSLVVELSEVILEAIGLTAISSFIVTLPKHRVTAWFLWMDVLTMFVCIRNYKDWWLYDNELHCCCGDTRHVPAETQTSCSRTDVNHTRGSNAWVLFTVVLANLILSFPRAFVAFIVLCRMLLAVMFCAFEHAFDSFSLLFPFWEPSDFLFTVYIVVPIYSAFVWLAKPLSSVLVVYAVYLSQTNPAGETLVYQICRTYIDGQDLDPCFYDSVRYTDSKILAIQLLVLNLHSTVDWIETMLSLCGIRPKCRRTSTPPTTEEISNNPVQILELTELQRRHLKTKSENFSSSACS